MDRLRRCELGVSPGNLFARIRLWATQALRRGMICIKALCRRFYRNGPLVFDLFEGALTIDGRPIALAPSEVALLLVLAAQPGVVAQYDRIFAELRLGGSERPRQALRSCIFGLRRKIERSSLHPEILLAEAGVGYRLAAPTEQPTHRARDSLPVDQERDEPQ
jgi:DNA-binding response OmpR family regulator